MTPSRNNKFTDNWVSASEIAAHIYCARSAWLSKTKQVEPGEASQARMAEGIKAHTRHELRWQSQGQAAKMAWWFLAAGIIVLILGYWLTHKST